MSSKEPLFVIIDPLSIFSKVDNVETLHAMSLRLTQESHQPQCTFGAGYDAEGIEDTDSGKKDIS